MNISFVQRVLNIAAVMAVTVFCFSNTADALQQTHQKWGTVNTGPAASVARAPRIQKKHRPSYPSSRYGSAGFSTFSTTPFGFSYSRSSLNGGFQLNIPIRPRYSSYYRAYGFGSPYGYGSVAGLYPSAGLGYEPYGGYYRTEANRDRPLNYTYPSISERLEAERRLRPVYPEPYRDFDVSMKTFIPTLRAAQPFQAKAEQAFKQGRYREAARLANEALLVDKLNGKLMLFSTQANFAAGYYAQAINELMSATDSLTSDQWDFVVKNYQQIYGQDNYVEQVNQLSQRIMKDSRDATAYILRGYQYAGLGYKDAASRDFNQALMIKPNDGLALRLLRGMTAQSVPFEVTTDAPIIIQSDPVVAPSINGPVIQPPADSQVPGANEPTSVLEEQLLPGGPVFDEPIEELPSPLTIEGPDRGSDD